MMYFSDLRNFYLFQFGQFVSQFGSKMTSFGIVLWAYKVSGSVLSTSMLVICSLLPSVLLSFVAGSLVDHMNKKKILLITDSVAVLFSLITLVLLSKGSLLIWHLYVINTVLGILDAFIYPTVSVAITILVPNEYYMKTSGIRSFSSSFVTIFAPILSTSVYTFWGIETIIVIDVVTFLFAFLTLLLLVEIPNSITKMANKKSSLLLNCRLGFGFIFNHRELSRFILFMGFINLIAAIYSCNLTPMVLLRSGNNEIHLGVVTSAIGVAGLFGSLFVSIKKQINKKITFIINSMSFSFLICNCLLGIGRNYYIWAIAVFLGNCMVPMLTASAEYIIRVETPLDMQGRVFSARNTLQYISIPIGYIVGGVISDRLLEPFMQRTSIIQRFLMQLVGSGRGSGIALVYIIIGFIGFIGCCYFRKDKVLLSLDNK